MPSVVKNLRKTAIILIYKWKYFVENLYHSDINMKIISEKLLWFWCFNEKNLRNTVIIWYINRPSRIIGWYSISRFSHGGTLKVIVDINNGWCSLESTWSTWVTYKGVCHRNQYINRNKIFRWCCKVDFVGKMFQNVRETA